MTAPVTAMSARVVPAVQAAARPGVAGLRVSITGAASAAGESPVTREAAVALPAGGAGNTAALTGPVMAERTERTQRIAGTSWRQTGHSYNQRGHQEEHHH